MGLVTDVQTYIYTNLYWKKKRLILKKITI